VTIGIKVADCLPVFVFARDLSCVGIAHCGWKGTVARIAGKLAVTMSHHHGLALTDMNYATGPCICPRCYPVGSEVAARLRESSPEADRFLERTGGDSKDDSYLLDIRGANRWLLSGMGLGESGSLDLCTRENATSFYSARRDPVTGRNLAVATLRP
jgi:copper oxidase (laccase) domain-containing protein